MVWFVNRPPSKNSDAVECFRCGGPHFAKNRQDASKNCKSKPSIAPSLPHGRRIEKEDDQDKSRSWASVAKSQAQDNKDQHFSMLDVLVKELRLMSEKMVKMEARIQDLVAQKKGKNRVDAACQIECGVDVGTQSEQFDGELVTVAAQTVEVAAGIDFGVQFDGDLGWASVQTDSNLVVGVDFEVQVDVGGVGVQTDIVVLVDGVDKGVQVGGQSDWKSVGVQIDVSEGIEVKESGSVALRVRDRHMEDRAQSEKSENGEGKFVYPCLTCEGDVVYTEREQQHHLKKGWKPPKRCFTCRDVGVIEPFYR